MINDIVFLHFIQQGGLDIGNISLLSVGEASQDGGSITYRLKKFDLRNIEGFRGFEQGISPHTFVIQSDRHLFGNFFPVTIRSSGNGNTTHTILLYCCPCWISAEILRTRSRSWLMWKGLAIKSTAPPFRASRAVSMVANPVMMITLVSGEVFLVKWSRSNPSGGFIFRSVIRISNFFSVSLSKAALLSVKTSTRQPLFSSIGLRRLQTIGSSSTTPISIFLSIITSFPFLSV